MAEITEPRRRNRLWMAARLLLSGAALVWVLVTIDLRSVLAALQEADPFLLALGVLMNVSTRLAAAERTQIMNKGLGLTVSWWQTLETLFISNFYSLLSPGPVLSGVVTVYRYNRFGASITGSVGSLLASRAVEAAAFVLWGLGCALLDARVTTAFAHALESRGAITGVIAGIVAAIAAIAIGAALILRRRDTSRPPGAGASMLDKIRAVFVQILQQGPVVALKAFVPASLQVLISGAAMVILARALHIELTWPSAIWMSAAVYAAVLLPISIAGLGIREVTLIKSFALVGLPPRAAVALSVLLVLDQLVSAMIGGVMQMGSVWTRARQSS